MLPSKRGFNLRKSFFFASLFQGPSEARLETPAFFAPISVLTEFQPPQAIWLISIDFDGFFLLAFQNIQFICEVNGRLKAVPERSSVSTTPLQKEMKIRGCEVWTEGG
ncbi:hypothetical protein AVEN_118292-1 [Araneus ventricosus]|uniref:Uncharacterized protein n=1 Tax=Araneus ventricosus TaxID=182803 RepID=A0A4Y2P3Z6_ARAVE|nr:hypothetical protein AVEN_118292-1 [Araneus ventricosus]